VNRRWFLRGLGASLLATPVSLAAQEAGKKVARVGRLSPLSRAADAPFLDAFRHGMRDLGWVEGQNLAIEARFANGTAAQLPALASELLRLNVDVILAGSTNGGIAAHKATTSIPIVMVTTGDPMAGGFIASLARPGGNVTGVTALGQELGAKGLELLAQAVPGLTRVAVLCNPTYPGTDRVLKALRDGARTLGMQLHVLEARDRRDVEAALAAASGERTRALMVLSDPMLVTHRKRIVELALDHRIPTMYAVRQYVDDGGLMFYGASLSEMYRHAASHVDRILKGARPGDIPVEQPTRFELVVNLKAARALGLAIPPSLLARADEVLE
jgi:putative tryptophan/tyrosine transport system substrate-binding protein